MLARKLPAIMLATALALATAYSSATSYNPEDLVGLWRVYSFWDGDVNDAGFTRSAISVDSNGIVTGSNIDSDASSGAYSGSVTITRNGGITLLGALVDEIKFSDFQMDTGKTILSGVIDELEFGTDAYRNFIIGVKQGSGFSTAMLSGNWEFYIYSDSPEFNEPEWNQLSVNLAANGSITSGTITSSAGTSGPITGSGTLSSIGEFALAGAWATNITESNIFLDADGTVMAGAFKTLDAGDLYSNILIGIKRSGSYQQAELSGDWDLYTFMDSTIINNSQFSRSPLSIDKGGNVSGLITDSNNSSSTISGSASIDNTGIVSLDGTWASSFTSDHFSMDSGHSFFAGTTNTSGSGREIIVGIDSASHEKRVLFANPASNQNQQGFIRIVNRSPASGLVTLTGIDKNGNTAPDGALTFTLAANASTQFNSLDYENGNISKGLSGGLGDGSGKWQFSVNSPLDIEVMGLIRTPDGFVTSVTEATPRTATKNQIYFANPASNQNQQSFLRFLNRSAVSGTVTLSGVDKNGNPAPGENISFTLDANESLDFNSLDYENGNANKGLSGALGNGAGKWWLTVTSALDLEVMSLIRTADGFLTNLSAVTPVDNQGNHRIFFANPASDTAQETFIRVINTSNSVGIVTISGVDDQGNPAPGGDVQFELNPLASSGLNIGDLENGNLTKGLSGALGNGVGRWQLSLSSSLSLKVMNMIRTADGFVTNLSEPVPQASQISHQIYMMNPGSNQNQRSFMRLVNRTALAANISISGIDDTGSPAPGGEVNLSLGAFSAREISVLELEAGSGDGLSGSLGDGTGKWRLTVTSDQALAVMSLLDTPNGFVTNLSRVVQ